MVLYLAEGAGVRHVALARQLVGVWRTVEVDVAP